MKGLSNISTRMGKTCTYFCNQFLNVYHHHGDQQGTDSGIQGLLLCQHKWQHLHNHQGQGHIHLDSLKHINPHTHVKKNLLRPLLD